MGLGINFMRSYFWGIEKMNLVLVFPTMWFGVEKVMWIDVVILVWNTRVFSPVGCLSWSCSIHLDWGSWDTTSSNLTTAGLKLRPSKRSCPCKTSGLSESCVSENPKESIVFPVGTNCLFLKSPLSGAPVVVGSTSNHRTKRTNQFMHVRLIKNTYSPVI